MKKKTFSLIFIHEGVRHRGECEALNLLDVFTQLQRHHPGAVPTQVIDMVAQEVVFGEKPRFLNTVVLPVLPR